MCSLNAVQMFSLVSFQLNRYTYIKLLIFSLLKMDKDVQVTLQDVETGLIYTTCLSPQDAHRVQTGK
jgi:hypothetical protein